MMEWMGWDKKPNIRVLFGLRKSYYCRIKLIFSTGKSAELFSINLFRLVPGNNYHPFALGAVK